MSKLVCSEERFLKDVAEHTMEVVQDDGLNRFLRFRKKGTSAYWFDIVTWQGILVINGDCGTYMFSRIPDMFNFFRMSPNDWNYNKDGLCINPSYWGEKLLAVSNNSGSGEGAIMKFSESLFLQQAKSWFDEHYEEEVSEDITEFTNAQRYLANAQHSDDPEDLVIAQRELSAIVESMSRRKVKREEEWQKVEEVLDYCEGEDSYYTALRDLEDCSVNFQDFYEVNCKEYVFHYIWCIYAISYAITKYDEHKKALGVVC